jgi:TolB protein
MRHALLITALTLPVATLPIATGSGSSRDIDRRAGDAAPFASRTGPRIVFSRLDAKTKKVRLYTVRPGGSGLRALTSRGADDSQADWSRDGTKVAFRRFRHPGTRDEHVDVVVVNRDGTHERNLTRRGCTGKCLGSEEPAWSPDGGRIAFTRAFGPISKDGNAATVGLFVMDADGSNVRQLTQLQPSGTEDHFPTWSPDGARIAFMRWNATARPRNASAIYSIDANGGDERLLRRIPRRWPGGGSPDWSPDGTRILFSTYCYYRDCGAPATGAQLFTINPDGADLRKLTHVNGNAYQGGWSPNGSRVVFTRNQRTGGVSDIYTINADGSKLRRLTRAQRPELFADYPDWGARGR